MEARHLNKCLTKRPSGRGKSAAPLNFTCVPGMARNYVGESPTARFSQSRRLAKGQGRHREVGSEGSPTQNGGAMNKKPDRRRGTFGTSGQSRPREAFWVRDRKALHLRLGCTLSHRDFLRS